MIITCPYCFHVMQDDEVWFRSEYISEKNELDDIIPEDFEDIDEFKQYYTGEDIADILARYEEWAFFQPREDADSRHIQAQALNPFSMTKTSTDHN